MKSIALITSVMLLTFMGPASAVAQRQATFRIANITPYDKGVPGQILELQVEGLAASLSMPAEDFEIEVMQDGVKQRTRARGASEIRTSEAQPDGKMGEMKSFQSISFVVPQGLHPGDAEISLFFGNKKSSPAKLTIVERPLPPLVAGLIAISIGRPDPAIRPEAPIGDMGWRLERDSKVELHVSPLTDPEDHNSAVLVRFKQRDAYVDGNARVVHQPRRTEQMDGGVAFLPDRDVLEVQVPAALTMGPAELEIQLRANGQTSDPVLLKVQITDATRAAEAPRENSPRLLFVTPQRIGAGQTFMVSVDYLRTLQPDPSQAMILIEQGTTRYVVKPDLNSAERMPDWKPDSPVVLMARATRQIIGTAKISVFNSLRGEQGGLSAPKSIEIVDEVLPPKVTGVAEATDEELAPLRQMYEIQRKEGRIFPEYDPSNRYLTIRGRGFDFNPNMVRIILEQAGRRVALRYADHSLDAGDFMIVRVPTGIEAGPVKISFENRGAESFSKPIIINFDLPKRP